MKQTEVNMVMDVILNMKLLNIEEIIALYQQKDIVLLNVVNFLTGQDYNQQYLDFIRSEQRRSNIKTKARIQPFCRVNKINLGYYDSERVFPRSVTDRNNALFSYKNHFCIIWKSEGVSFNQAIKELKDKIVDNYITEENVHSQFKYEFIPKKMIHI